MNIKQLNLENICKQESDFMNLFLTSNIGGVKKENGNKIPIKISENNDFLNN